MPSRTDENVLNYQQLNAFHHFEIEGKTLDETGEIIGVSGRTIERWKDKPAWRDLGIAALEEEGHTLTDWAKKVIEMKDRKKSMNISGQEVMAEDNQAQIRYLDSVEKVFGLAAPQKHEITAGISDAEVDERLDEAAKKHRVASVEVKEQGPVEVDTSEGE